MSEDNIVIGTRADYLRRLGLEEHATWEEVHSAYAGLLEQALQTRDEAESLSEADDHTLMVEEAFQFLVQDPVIQARRETAPRRKPVPRVVPHDFSPSSTNGSSASLPLAALVLGTILFIAGILAHMVTSVFSSRHQIATTHSLRADELEQIRQQNKELSERIRDLGTRLTLMNEENQRLREEVIRDNAAIEEGSTDAQLTDDDHLLINLPPAAFTERDKMYVVRHTGEIEEAYTMITPGLIDAGIRCDKAQAEALLSDGADINELDARGDSALAWAVKRNCPEVVNLLLKKGAVVNSRSDNGFTPYLWARIYGNVRMQNLLRDAGADTSVGAYWRRLAEDGKADYLEHSLEAACRDPLAPGCRG